MSAGRLVAERLVDLRRLWREPPILAVIAFNLIPAASVVLFGWSAGLLVVLYWIENVIIGLFNAPKIYLAGASKGEVGQAMFFTPFFILHYGLFTLVHGVFVFLIFGGAFGGGPFGGAAEGRELWAALGTTAFRWNVAALLLLHLLDFLFEWIGRRRYLGVEPGDQMMSVYPRIIILHLTVLGGAFILMQTGDPLWGVLLIAAFKTAFDVLAKAGRLARNRSAAAVGSGLATRKPAA